MRQVLLVLCVMLAVTMFQSTYFALGSVDRHTGALYQCRVNYEALSGDTHTLGAGGDNIREVLWSYEGLCEVNVRKINETYVEVWVSPANNISKKLVSLLVYRSFNYAWLIVFNDTMLAKPIFVGFTPIYTTIALNRSVNTMKLNYQGVRVTVKCGDFVTYNTALSGIWLVEADGLLSAVYGSGSYPLIVNAEILMPDGMHVVELELNLVNINASETSGVCKPQQYIDWKLLAELLALAVVPAAAILTVRRAKR